VLRCCCNDTLGSDRRAKKLHTGFGFLAGNLVAPTELVRMRGTHQRSRDNVQVLRTSWYPEQPLRFLESLFRVLRTNPRRPVHRVSNAWFANQRPFFRSSSVSSHNFGNRLRCHRCPSARVTARDPDETGDPLSVGVTSVTMQQ